MAMSASARTLTPSEALKRAGDMGRGITTSRASEMPKPIMTVGQQDTPALYLFNKAEGGYVIVSADDVAAPVLGYSDTGSLDPENLPANFLWWLNEYEEAIRTASEEGATPYVNISRADYAPIAPLVKTLWNQGTPFNDLCPKIGTETTVTGCVATAMAQVIKYHNWPAQLTAEANFNYNWEAGGTALTWNAAGTTLDWDNMLDNYTSGNYTPAQANAVATLMKACGYSVEMDYDVASKGGSGAATFDVAEALIKYFNYDKGTTPYFRMWFGKEKWEEMIYNNLRDCGPIVFSGSNASGGHAFVCDGYQSNGYYHINWGWSGMSDGYFLLSALDPANQGIGGSSAGYNNNQMVILGITKPGANKAHPYMASMKGFTGVALGSTLSISFSSFVANYSAVTFSGIIYARIVPEDGSPEKLSAIDSFNGLMPGYGWDKPTYQLNLNATNFPSNGTYKVYLATKDNATGDVTDILVPASAPQYVLVTRNGTKYTAEMPVVGEFSIPEVEFTTPMFSGSTQFLVRGNSVWTGSESVVENIYGVLLKDSKIVAAGSALPLEFKANGEEEIFEYVSSWGDIDPGEYHFAFVRIADNQYKVLTPYFYPVEVKEAPASTSLSVNATEVGVVSDPSDTPGYIRVNIPVQCVSGYFFGSVTAAIFNYSTQSYITEFDSNIFSVEEGQAAWATATGMIPGASIGSKYLLAVFNGNKQISGGVVVTIGVSSGIDSVEIDGNEGEAEFFNLQGVRVDNPSGGIFIRRQGGKVEKVVVK